MRRHYPLPPDLIGAIHYAPEGFRQQPGLVSQFESLGDNCEFGFVQRFHGAEPASLLRWAYTLMDGVVKGLGDSWSDVFSWDHLVPWNSNMVFDRQYGAAFHCSIHCHRPNDRAAFDFILPDVARRKVWEREAEKFHALRSKTLEALADHSKIYVAKANGGLSYSDALRLKAALDQHGNHRLLCVVSEDTTEERGIILVAENLKLAVIPTLASYSDVSLAAYNAWTNLLEVAVETPWH